MLKLSKLTDYATVILSFMAKDHERTRSAVEIANTTGIALPTVSKILKSLINANVLISVRGTKGGYALALAPEKITVATIISALEGPIAVTECSNTQQGCEKALGCNLRGHWNVINQAIYRALESVTLADMIKPQETLIPLTNLHR
jgi:FeS assembly SUF system regulator